MGLLRGELTSCNTECEYRGCHLPELAYIPLHEPCIGEILAVAPVRVSSDGTVPEQVERS